MSRAWPGEIPASYPLVVCLSGPTAQVEAVSASSAAMTTTNDPIAELERTSESNWSAIKSAAAAATAKRRTLVDELTKMKLVPPDSTFVMFGSLARDEVTAGSDLDWTLLI